jgi:hypothetical protein
LHFARRTNIDRRFKVAARTLTGHASRISSGPPDQMTKLACRRPFAEQNPASRAAAGPIVSTSLVS